MDDLFWPTLLLGAEIGLMLSACVVLLTVDGENAAGGKDGR